MIVGQCPYIECGKPLMTPIAPECPAFSIETCEHCHKRYWLYHSRWNPNRYTEDEFAKLFAVNEASKTISPLPGTPPVGAAISAFPMDIEPIWDETPEPQ